MGRVYRRDKRFCLDYRDHSGRRVRKLARRCKTLRDAERLLAETEAVEREIARDIARGFYDGRTNHVAVRELLDAYLLHQLATKRYGTVLVSRISFRDTLGYFELLSTKQGNRQWPPRSRAPLVLVQSMPRRFVRGPLDVEFVDELTPGKVEDWVAARRQSDGAYATRTLNIRLAALRALLNWAERQGRIKGNPVRGIGSAGKPAQQRWRALTSEEVQALLDASPEPYRTLWLAFASTGMRHGELVELAWPDVSVTTNTIRVRQETCKTHRQRDIPMTAPLRERLTELKAQAPDLQGHVFVNSAGRPWRNNLENRFRACAQKAGLVSRVVRANGAWRLEYLDPLGNCIPDAFVVAGRSEA